jgi:hypothetical protein
VILVNGGGNVGIGTETRPESKLVIGNGVDPAGVRIPNGGLCIDSDGDCTPPSEGGIRVGPGGIHGTDSSGQNVLIVPDTGRVGIGTSDPAAKLDVNGDLNVRGEALVLIKRFLNQGDNASFDTEISASDYECVAAGWLAEFDIDEDNAGDYGVWTYVENGFWQARIQFHTEGDHEDPDVDILCFRKEIAVWQGGSRSSNSAQ